jgi:DNA-binding PucR family transcriptional regulator
LRHTLRAYFAAERNVSSAAAALGVTRQTVTNRLRVIEETLDRPLGVWATEIEAALRMEELAPDIYTGRVGSA